MPSLKLYWRKPVIKSVTAFRIVEHLDVVEDVLPGVIPLAGRADRRRPCGSHRLCRFPAMTAECERAGAGLHWPACFPAEGTTHKNRWDELPSSCTSAAPEIRPVLPE